jgi:hypothetical protein
LDGTGTRIDIVEELDFLLEKLWNDGDKGKSKCLEKHLHNAAFAFTASLAYGLC